MNQQNPFKWRHFEVDLILLCVRWYIRYSLSDRDLEEIMLERELHVDHTTIYRSRATVRAGTRQTMPLPPQGHIKSV